MNLHKLAPMLWTADLKGTIDFYTAVLGFKLNEYNSDWGWCHLESGGVNIMFALPNKHTPFEKSALTGSLYIYTEEVDEAWGHLQTNTKTAYGICNFIHGMREFAIYDNNGYMLQFGRELKEGETPESQED